MLNPYLLYAKLAAGAVLLALLGWLALTVNGWHKDSLRVAAVEARSAEIAKQAAQTIALVQSQLKSSQEASRGYSEELETLRSARKPAPVVRLCRPAANPVPAGSDPAARVDGGAAPAGLVREDAAGDREVGQALFNVAEEGDRCSAQVRALQGWIKATR